VALLFTSQTRTSHVVDPTAAFSVNKASLAVGPSVSGASGAVG